MRKADYKDSKDGMIEENGVYCNKDGRMDR